MRQRKPFSGPLDPDGFRTCCMCHESFHLDTFVMTAGDMATLRKITMETGKTYCTTCAILYYLHCYAGLHLEEK